jgi:hypothetical protein
MTLLTADSYPVPKLSLRNQSVDRNGLRRLFAAAVVSDQFRATLLSKPDEALANGYLGQAFLLTDQEKTLIKSIRADTLTDFAQKVNRALKGV